MERFSYSIVVRLLTTGIALLLLNSCGVIVRSIDNGISSIGQSQLFHQGRYSTLSEKEKVWAKIAWRYFENNYNANTGLVNSIDKYPSTTLWHIGDYLAALVAAYELELIDYVEFDRRFSRLLRFLNTMPLFYGRLPNKVYHTKTGKMVNYDNNNESIGWSAIDIGRAIIWLQIARARYPKYSEYIDKAILRWNFCDILDECGTLFGGVKIKGEIDLYQEGRLGYEEYAAMGYKMIGFDTTYASKIEPYEKINIFGIDIHYDARDPRKSGTYAPVLSNPYLLHGLEFNWDDVFDTSTMDSTHTDKTIAGLANNIYQVQQARYDNHRILTARGDHQLKKAPYFLYDSIFSSGYAWNTIADNGETYSRLALVSTRVGFGMWALWKTPYTDRLMSIIDTLYDEKRGWYEGRYEKTAGYEKEITSSTNSMVLSTLLYKVQGKLYQKPLEPSYGEIRIEDMWRHPGNCFPPKRSHCEVEPVKSIFFNQ